jgi:hypothetical protein
MRLLQPVDCSLQPNSSSSAETLLEPTSIGFQIVARTGSSVRLSRATANRDPRASHAVETASHGGGRDKNKKKIGAPLGWVGLRPLVLLLKRLFGAALNEIGGHYGAIRPLRDAGPSVCVPPNCRARAAN